MRQLPYIRGIDGLRAISVLLVLLAHWEPSAWFGSLLNWGRGGLMVFFVISGFLITRILLNQRDISSNWRSELATFYRRRALRIFPLYYLALGFVVLIDLTTATTKDVLWHALFLNNLSAIYLHGGVGPYGAASPWWSLAVEEQFYLLWAPLVLIAPRRWVIPAICLAAVAVITFRSAGWHAGTPLAFVFVHTLGNLDALAAGCTVAVICRFKVAEDTRSGLIAVIVAIASLLLLILLALSKPAASSFTNLVLSDADWYLLAAAAILLLTTHRATSMRNALEHPVLVFIGKRSYGIYVLHQVVAHTISLRIWPRFQPYAGFKLELYGPLEFLIYGAVTLTLAALSFKYLESPLLELRARSTAHAG